MPRTTAPVVMDEGNNESHPAFAVVVVTQSHGTEHPLFGSDLKHRNSFNLTILDATRRRDLNHDWIHPRRVIAEVEMSPAQWASVMSSIGDGRGTPVTLRYANGEHQPDFPFESRIQKNLDEVNGEVEGLLADVSAATERLATAINDKLGVKETREALNALQATLRNAPGNAEFAVKSLRRAGEDVVSAVKAETETFGYYPSARHSPGSP